MSIVFNNVVQTSGIDNEELGAISVAWMDFNADGLLDLWTAPHGFNSEIEEKNPKLYLNQGDGTFDEIAETVFADKFYGDNHGSAWIDFDNDGDSDLFITNGGAAGVGEGPNKLFVNEGGILEDRAIELNIDFSLGRGRTSLWFDGNKDGLLDVVQINADRPDGQAPSTFWQQTSKGFVNANDTVGFEVPESAVTAQIADLFGDGSQDLLVFSDDTSPVKVYDTSSPVWNDITASLPQISDVRDVAIADFNNDGVQDIFLTRVKESVAQVNSNIAIAKKTAFARLTAQQGNPEAGISWQSDGEITIDSSTGWTLNKWEGSQVPESQIFLGSQGINPSTSKFTLSTDDPAVWGKFSLTENSPSGLYISYDRGNRTWEAINYNTGYGSLNLLVESSEPLSNVETVGFVQPDLAGLGGLSPVLLVYDPETGEYLEQTEVAGLSDPTSSRSVVSGDFDNDGDVDLFLESSTAYYTLPSILYDNQGDGTFIPVTDAGGAQIEFFGPRYEDFDIGINVATGDYDGDGFLDIFSGSSTVHRSDGTHSLGTPNYLFRNQGNDNNWLQIDLQGTESNRDGIGAKVFVTAGGVTQLRENSGGMHRIAQDQPLLHFGLGENEQVDLLRIEWPSGAVRELSNITANQTLEIIEDEETNNNELLIDSPENKILYDFDSINIQGTGEDTLYGDNGNDVLRGDRYDNTIHGVAGEDTLYGDNGNDVLRGNQDNDTIHGGAGEDTLYGDNGNDVLRGNQDDDTIHGVAGRDTLYGGLGNDRLMGNQDNDLLFGGAGDDSLYGGLGSDRIFGNIDNDLLFGGVGDDTLSGGKGNDVLVGNEGKDIFVMAVNEGTDKIFDFQLGEDRFALAEELSFTELTFSGNDILFGNETLATLNISAESLTLADFMNTEVAIEAETSQSVF